MITIDLATFFSETAKLSDLSIYIEKALDLAGEGNDVAITGKGPVSPRAREYRPLP